jgi:mannose-6-phosphate isomerase-like protein (cupin superfamily)
MATKTEVKAELFSLKTPYLSAGRISTTVSETEDLWIATKMNAEGGENAIHKHTVEDHAFIVLEGEVTFFDKEGNETVLGPYQGIMLPKGAYYRYLNTGPGNLMILRIGAGKKAGGGNEARIGPDGKPLPAYSVDNMHIEAVPIPGKFFGE